jgi:signal peptidase I
MVTNFEGYQGIVVNFTRVVDGGDDITHTLKNVKSVSWSHDYSRDNLVDVTTKAGFLQTTYEVTGFIEVYDVPEANVEAQQALETILRTIGTGTLHYTGSTDQTEVRFSSLSFEEYRGQPVGEYTVEFITETANPQAHSVVKIGSITLSAANGYDTPTVTDTVKSQGTDEQIVAGRNREFQISGMLVGANETEVNTAQAALVTEVSGTDTLVLDISSASGGALYTVRPGAINFGAPRSRGQTEARSYSFSCKTHEDYSKEPYTLGETPLTFGGTITIDVVDGTNYTSETELLNSTYIVTSEQFTATGKKYFVDETAYAAFRDSFRPLPVGTFVQSTNTRNSLELTAVSVGKFERDANDPGTLAKRYSCTVNLTFTWKKNQNQTNQLVLGLRLGMNWYKVGTMSFNTSVDATGNVTTRSVSMTGQMKEGDLVSAKGLIGTPQSLNDPSFGDPASPTHGNDYYVTSVSINKKDVVYTIGPGQEVVYDITVSANQLDTASQKLYFISSVFQATDTEQLIFDKITNVNKSIANRYSAQDSKYIVTSMNMTVSGEIWEADNGSGAPVNPYRGIQFLRLFDATYTGELNKHGPTHDDRGPALYGGNAFNASDYSQILPDRVDGGKSYKFTITNISVGDWQAFTKQKDPGKGANYWLQPITITGTAVFDLTDSGTQPELVETTAHTIRAEKLRYQELNVAGFGIRFKAIGIEPSTAETTHTISYESRAEFEKDKANHSLAARPPLDPPTAWTPWRNAAANYEQTKANFSVSGGTQAKWTYAWKAAKAESEI